MGFPWLEQNLLLLLECLIVLNAFFFVIPLQWYLLVLLSFWLYFLASHSSWQLLLSVFGLVVWAYIPSFGLLLSFLGLGFQLLLPIPQICRSTLIAIGRRSVTLTDQTRTNETDKRQRRVNVSLWYPCQDGNFEYHELFDHFDVVGRALVRVLPAIPNRLRFLLSWMLSHINGPSSALKNAPKAADGAKRPLVLLLHGITGPRWQYVSLAERLAESGFIVVAPEHPFDTACSVYEDGTTCLYKLGVPPKDDVFAEEWERWNGYLKERLRDTHELLMPHLRADPALDVGTIDWDLGVSVVGHSFGAAEAVMLAAKEPHTYRHIVCHDLWLYPVPLELRLGKKVPKESNALFISSQNWQWTRNLHRIERLSQGWGDYTSEHYNLVLKRARHHNFHDLALIAPSVGKLLKMLGHGNAREMLHAVNETTLAFLKLTAKGDRSRDTIAMASGRYFECVAPMVHDETKESHAHFEESEK